MLKIKKLLVVCILVVSVLGLFCGEVFAEGNKIGIVNADVLNVREAPGTYAGIITQISEGTQVVILDYSDGWYKVSIGDITGWVCAQYVSNSDSSTLTGIIIADSVNIRSGPGKSYYVITMLNSGERVSVLGRSEDWYNIQMSDGTTGWVYSELISVGTSRSESLGIQIVNFAKKFLGVKYVYGGSSTKGFDCSGFVKYVYNNFGIDIERVAADQASQGVKVSKSNLRQGDLVFFDTDGGNDYINHVGIYIGNGSFIHASSGAGKVIISDLTSGFYANNYMTARRYIR